MAWLEIQSLQSAHTMKTLGLSLQHGRCECDLVWAHLVSDLYCSTSTMTSPAERLELWAGHLV
jgi:hypothetical protein